MCCVENEEVYLMTSLHIFETEFFRKSRRKLSTGLSSSFVFSSAFLECIFHWQILDAFPGKKSCLLVIFHTFFVKMKTYFIYLVLTILSSYGLEIHLEELISWLKVSTVIFLYFEFNDFDYVVYLILYKQDQNRLLQESEQDHF